MPTAKICKFRPRTELRDLCAPDRDADAAILRVLDGYAANGKVSYADDGSAVVEVGEPEPYVSPYLLKPLRSEAEVRAARSPRIPQAKGLAQCIAECTGIDKAFRALVGGGQ